MCDGYWKDKEQAIQLSWEQSRWQTFYTVYVQLDKKGRRKLKTPKDLVIFPWEKEKSKMIPPTKEETIKARKKLGETWD